MRVSFRPVGTGPGRGLQDTVHLRCTSVNGTARDGRSPDVADAVLAELVRKGWVTPAPRPLTGAPARVPVAPFAELMRELGADRADR